MTDPAQSEVIALRAQIEEDKIATAEINEIVAKYQADDSALRATVKALKATNENLRMLIFCAYQFVGVHNGNVKWLDALSAAAHGDKFSERGLLPVMPNLETTNHSPTCGCHLCVNEATVKALREALEKVLPFAQNEMACREQSYLPEPFSEDEEWCLTEAQEAVETIRAALELAKEKP